MKRILTMISAAALVLSMGAVFTACEGPAGPAGKDGANGSNGINGINGTNGNQTCGVCHNSGTVMFAKILEYENSVHFTGGDIEGDRGNPCISCHTSEGFVSRINAGTDTAASKSATYSPINCRTCHFIHTAYDSTDWSLRTTSQVALQIDKTITLPDLGKGNLCANCHQPRLPSPMVNPANGSATITITSNRWGLHHGPQSALLTGKAAYQFSGAAAYGSSSHKNAPDGCIQCHMSYSLNLTAGGHTFKAGYLNGTTNTINIGACATCHNGSQTATITAGKILTDQNAIDTLVSHLKTKLVAANILDPATGLLKMTAGKCIITNDQAGAVLNYQMVTEDKSHGVHNLNYATDMLNASITALSK